MTLNLLIAPGIGKQEPQLVNALHTFNEKEEQTVRKMMEKSEHDGRRLRLVQVDGDVIAVDGGIS